MHFCRTNMFLWTFSDLSLTYLSFPNFFRLVVPQNYHHHQHFCCLHHMACNPTYSELLVLHYKYSTITGQHTEPRIFGSLVGSIFPASHVITFVTGSNEYFPWVVVRVTFNTDLGNGISRTMFSTFMTVTTHHTLINFNETKYKSYKSDRIPFT